MKTDIQVKKLLLFVILCIFLSNTSFSQQAPFNGPHDIPGRVEAEDFDTGGQNVAFFDSDQSRTASSSYRTGGDTDVEVKNAAQYSNGQIVEWTANGEWMEYTINVTMEDDYVLSVTATSITANYFKGFQFFIDDVRISDSIEVTNSGWFSEWLDDYEVEAHLTEGEHILKFSLITAGQWCINVDYIDFVPKSLAGKEPLSVNKLIGDNCVMQRNDSVQLWGIGEPGNKVNIDAGWGVRDSVIIDSEGNWKAKIKTTEAGGPYNLNISDVTKSLEFSDVMLGEVWVCGGQSNMAFQLGNSSEPIVNREVELANAVYPNIRYFRVDNPHKITKQTSLEGGWSKVIPPHNEDVPAIPYFFARKLHLGLDSIPIGIVINAVGGTVGETWIEDEYIKKVPGFEHIDDTISYYTANSNDIDQYNTPLNLYNGRTNPLLPLKIRGVIWYQGESNTNNPQTYYDLFPLLIDSWRERWEQPEFPFYIVPITPFKNYDNDAGKNSAEIREAHFLATQKTNCEIVSSIDIGSKWRIHPEFKSEAGLRLGLLALEDTYGIDTIKGFCPIYKYFNYSNDTAIVTFDHVYDGLQPLSDNQMHFEIAGFDGVFYPANVQVDGNKMYFHSNNVEVPVQVRYAWVNWVDNYFYNSVGLPSPSFRTYSSFAYTTESYIVDHTIKEISIVASDVPVKEIMDSLKVSGSATVKIFTEEGVQKVSGIAEASDIITVYAEHMYDSTSYTLNVSNSVSSNSVDLDEIENILLYPNPARDWIKVSNIPIGSNVFIINSLGKVCLQKQIQSSHETISINELSIGLYCVMIEGESNAQYFAKH